MIPNISQFIHEKQLESFLPHIFPQLSIQCYEPSLFSRGIFQHKLQIFQRIIHCPFQKLFTFLYFEEWEIRDQDDLRPNFNSASILLHHIH